MNKINTLLITGIVSVVLFTLIYLGVTSKSYYIHLTPLTSTTLDGSYGETLKVSAEEYRTYHKGDVIMFGTFCTVDSIYIK